MKQRLTFLTCANGDGTEKFPLFIIGKSAKPHCFKTKTEEELGFYYSSNAKVWMNLYLFRDLLQRFNAYNAETEGRKVGLLLDNTSSHIFEGLFSQLSNKEIIFFTGE